MPTSVITNVDTGSVILVGVADKDELLTFLGVATVVEGTILARDSATLKLIPYVKGGVTNDDGIPKAIITYDVTSVGAGDVPVRVMQAGTVDGSRLVINADGDGSNIDAAVLDGLRDYSMVTIDVTNLSILDNQ